MFCRTCNYPLWNIRDRRCPECGTDFKPSDFRFVPGAVRFCCPHCAQAYYGTTPEGHLQPKSFLCVNCQKPVEMDQTIVLPAEGVEEEATSAERMPWLDDSRGFFSRWFKTIGWSMTSPTRLIAQTPLSSSLGKAFRFALITFALYSIAMMVPFCGFGLFGVLRAGPPTRGAGGAAIGAMFATMVMFWFLMSLVLALAWVCLCACMSHGLLLLGGAVEGGLRRTMQCFLYSTGAFALMAVPCLGGYMSSVSWIWAAVSAILMIRKSQKVSGGRATFAVLTPPITIVMLSVLGIVFLVAPAVSRSMAAARASVAQMSAAASAAGGVAAEQQTAKVVLDALLKQASHPPLHAARLVASQDVAPTQLFLSQRPNAIGPDSIPVGRISLQDLFTAPPSAQERELARAEAELPAAVIAHRVGDFVFTYHGVDMQNGDGDLWLFVAEVRTTAGMTPPIPVRSGRAQVSRGPGAGGSVWLVGTNGGNVEVVPNLASATAAQNELRASYGLPGLPSARDVKDYWPVAAKPK
jgi:hypothetical protein